MSYCGDSSALTARLSELDGPLPAVAYMKMRPSGNCTRGALIERELISHRTGGPRAFEQCLSGGRQRLAQSRASHPDPSRDRSAWAHVSPASVVRHQRAGQLPGARDMNS